MRAAGPHHAGARGTRPQARGVSVAGAHGAMSRGPRTGAHLALRYLARRQPVSDPSLGSPSDAGPGATRPSVPAGASPGGTAPNSETGQSQEAAG